MTGKPACEFAADIHGLGYTLAGNHRHLDNESYPHFTFSRDWSIYCEVVTADNLVLAATSGDMQLVRFCLDLRIGPDEREDIGELAEQPGRSALTAAEQGHVSIVQLLLDHGATFNKPDGYGRTALEAARANKHSHVVEALEKTAS